MSGKSGVRISAQVVHLRQLLFVSTFEPEALCLLSEALCQIRHVSCVIDANNRKGGLADA